MFLELNHHLVSLGHGITHRFRLLTTKLCQFLFYLRRARTMFGATWELRFGANNRFRVFYEVDAAEQMVFVLAIGVKDREKLIVGGEEIEL